MSEKRTTARAFHDAVVLEDWRVLFYGAYAARFVAAIAEDSNGAGVRPAPVP